MTNRIESPHPAIQISHVLASPRFIKRLPLWCRRKIEEIRYHLTQFPGLIPFGTSIALVANSPIGSLRVAFDESGSEINVRVHDLQPKRTHLALSNRDGIALMAPMILETAFEFVIIGGITPDLWDGPFRPLSSNLPYWPQDHQQSGPDAGDEIEILDLSLL